MAHMAGIVCYNWFAPPNQVFNKSCLVSKPGYDVCTSTAAPSMPHDTVSYYVGAWTAPRPRVDS